ncbi:two-pore potassium channel 4-like [Trifolium pratense]|uniref:two-pore potassium channel 4-like n=1 Tax=Trifolium pratense TaxID=57577 RepID=UPI001E695000|nr:two-pore potassium channel 4-like [Trifolium pratense]
MKLPMILLVIPPFKATTLKKQIHYWMKNTTSSTVTIVDALYFGAVTLSTVGYGDIIPDTAVAKIITSVFILLGFVVSYRLNNVFEHICDTIEASLVRNKDSWNPTLKAWMFDDTEISKRAKFCICVVVIILLIALGTITTHRIEKLHWIDSFYFSVTSVTTVGYGEFSFKTTGGKWWAIIWILIGTTTAASCLTYLSEYYLPRRSGDMTQWILKKKITASDLAAT